MRFLSVTQVMTQSEAAIQNDIRVAVGAHDCMIFRTNVGKVRTDTGRYFDTGLPQGHPDLYGFKFNNGKVFYIEVKNKHGRAREDQKQFHYMLTNHGIIHGIARSPEDALKIIDEELVGYGFE